MKNRFRLIALVAVFGFAPGISGIAFACGDSHADAKTSCGAAAKAGKAPHSLVLTATAADAGEPGVKKASCEVKGMTCDSCRKHIESALLQVEGVKSVQFVKKMAYVSYTEAKVKPDALVAAIQGAGYEAIVPASDLKTQTN
jgi:copper chaperone CopZ